jgi:hypothetical protein
MQDLQNLETSVLLDMLSQHTKEYTAILFDANTQDGIEALESKIFKLQDEINSRKSKAQDEKTWISLIQKELNSRNDIGDNTSKSDPNIAFPEKDSDTTQEE